MKHHLPRARRLGAITTIALLTAAACGSDDSTGSAEPDDAMTSAEPMDDDGAMTDMEMSEMNMGDPDATPADEVAGAAVARGEVVLLDTRPAGYDDVAGTALIARHDGGTTVTARLTGLLPDTDYISHVHAGPCSENGGAHYQYEVGGSVLPPNEIHLAFTSDGEGNGAMTAENHRVAGLDARAFVVHPAEFVDNKVACADFVEDEPGAAAAMIEAAGAEG